MIIKLMMITTQESRDLKSAVNKEYLNDKFLKKDKDGNYYDARQMVIKNTEPYYDGLYDNNTLVSKGLC